MEKQRPNYKAMTGNERLVVAGLLEKFDKAVRLRNVVDAVTILQQVDYSKSEGESIVKTIFENPSKYGY